MSPCLSVTKTETSFPSFSGWTMPRHTWCCGPELWIHPYSYSIFHERWRSSWTTFTSVTSRARSHHPIPVNRAHLDTIPLARYPWTNPLSGFTWRTGVSTLWSLVMLQISRYDSNDVTDILHKMAQKNSWCGHYGWKKVLILNCDQLWVALAQFDN